MLDFELDLFDFLDSLDFKFQVLSLFQFFSNSIFFAQTNVVALEIRDLKNGMSCDCIPADSVNLVSDAEVGQNLMRNHLNGNHTI